MPNTDLFSRFVQFVENEHANGNEPSTVSDLRVAVQEERLTEISGWSFAELDEVEEESWSYEENAILGNIVAEQPELQAVGS